MLRTLQGAPVDDRALRRLVESSTLTVHLVNDIDHRLLTASPSRAREWKVSPSALCGRCLWPAASPAIHAAEAGLESRGWWACSDPAPVEIELDAWHEGFLPILSGRMVWERVWLSDGQAGRLCTLLDGGPARS